MDKKKIGSEGEKFAADYLRKIGYKILETNYRSGHLEIDIIAQRKQIIVFVEVKTRFVRSLLLPQEAVSRIQQRNIVQGAHHYMRRNCLHSAEARFDIMAVLYGCEGIREIQHIPHAFAAEMR